MRRVLERQAEFAGSARFQGKLFQVRGYPGAVPSAHRSDQVVGELHRLKNAGTVFTILDDYEMCSERFPEPREYRREVVTITNRQGRQMNAWIYLYNLPTGILRRIESGDYRDTPTGSGRSSRGGAATGG